VVILLRLNRSTPNDLGFWFYQCLPIIRDFVELSQLICDGFRLHYPKWVEFLFQKLFMSQQLGHIQQLEPCLHHYLGCLHCNFSQNVIPMTHLNLFTTSVLSTCDMVVVNTVSPFNAFAHSCWIRTSCIFIFHLSLVIFLISHLVRMVFAYFPWAYSSCCEFRSKLTPMFWCVEKN